MPGRSGGQHDGRHNTFIPEDRCVAALRDAAAERAGVAPTRLWWVASTRRPCYLTILNRFGSWDGALQAAGLLPKWRARVATRTDGRVMLYLGAEFVGRWDHGGAVSATYHVGTGMVILAPDPHGPARVVETGRRVAVPITTILHRLGLGVELGYVSRVGLVDGALAFGPVRRVADVREGLELYEHAVPRRRRSA